MQIFLTNVTRVLTYNGVSALALSVSRFIRCNILSECLTAPKGMSCDAWETDIPTFVCVRPSSTQHMTQGSILRGIDCTWEKTVPEIPLGGGATGKMAESTELEVCCAF